MKINPLLVGLFLISPVFILLISYPGFSVVDSSEVFQVFKFTFHQALVSSLLATVFGALAGLSLSSIFDSKKYSFVESLYYAPSFVPVLFVVFSCLNIGNLWQISFKGFWGIVVIHVLINVGLVGALYSKILIHRLSLMNRLSLVQGLGVWRYLRKIVFAHTKKDLLFLFAVVFIFCFTSFSIPLIIGGVNSTTIELLIYEKLVVLGEVEQALSLALLQLLFLVFFLGLINFTQAKEKAITTSWNPFFKNKIFLLVPIFSFIVLFVGLWLSASFSLGWFTELALLPTLIKSLGLALFCGYSIFLFFQFIFSILPHSTFEFFMSVYSSPSTVLIGLALVVVSSVWWQGRWLVLLFGYVLLYVPVLFKMFVQNFLSSLKPALKVSRAMSANYWLRFKMITFPLSYSLCLFLGFLTAIWVLGDYALASLLLEADSTIALVAKNLLRSYRLDQASFVITIIIFCEFIIYLLYKGLAYVGGQKY